MTAEAADEEDSVTEVVEGQEVVAELQEEAVELPEDVVVLAQRVVRRPS